MRELFGELHPFMGNDRVDSIGDSCSIPLWKAVPILEHISMHAYSSAANVRAALASPCIEGLPAFVRNSPYANIFIRYTKLFHPLLDCDRPLPGFSLGE